MVPQATIERPPDASGPARVRVLPQARPGVRHGSGRRRSGRDRHVLAGRGDVPVRLVWTALISLPLASAVQETAARLGLTSGRGLMSLIKEEFARPVLWFAAVLVVGANVFNIGADLGSMAEAFRPAHPGSVRRPGRRDGRHDPAARDLCELRSLLADPALARAVDLRVRARAVRRGRRLVPRSRSARPGGSVGSMPRRSVRCASTSCRACRPECS